MKNTIQTPLWVCFLLIWANGILAGIGIQGLVTKDFLGWLLPLGIAGGLAWPLGWLCGQAVNRATDAGIRPAVNQQAETMKPPRWL